MHPVLTCYARQHASFRDVGSLPVMLSLCVSATDFGPGSRYFERQPVFCLCLTYPYVGMFVPEMLGIGGNTLCSTVVRRWVQGLAHIVLRGSVCPTLTSVFHVFCFGAKYNPNSSFPVS